MDDGGGSCDRFRIFEPLWDRRYGKVSLSYDGATSLQSLVQITGKYWHSEPLLKDWLGSCGIISDLMGFYGALAMKRCSFWGFSTFLQHISGFLGCWT